MEQTTYILSDGTRLGSWDDFGLAKTERTKISPPVRRTNEIKIPGVSGTVDLMRYMDAAPTYETRTLTDVFVLVKGQKHWEHKKMMLYRVLNGSACRIICDRDKSYYWEGTVSVTDVSDGRDVLKIKVTAKVFPYKYELCSSTEPWLWDPFNFHYGVIRDYRDISVSASRSFTVRCGDLPVMPGFWTSDSGMGVTYNGVSAALTQRSASSPKTFEQFYGILLPGGGDHTLTLTGTGTVWIDYRGGFL